jgi:hypothetical protein
LARFLFKKLEFRLKIRRYRSEIFMNKIHIAIAAHDIIASVEDYSKRLGCQPCVVVANEYALWRTESINLSIRRTTEAIGTVRHLGWEDATATSFIKERDVNGVEWERFSAAVQAEEIREIWPEAEYYPDII